MSADNPLPRMSNAVAEAVTQKHPIILNAYDHDFMMDEISRHQMLDHDEVIDNGSSSDDDEDDEVDVGAGETDDKGEEDSNKEQIVCLTKEQIGWYPNFAPTIMEQTSPREITHKINKDCCVHH